MLVAAFGAPTVFADFGFKIVRAILDTVFSDCAHILANTSEDFRIAWTQAEGKAIALTCSAPDEELANLFVESGAPLLLFSSSGIEIAADHIRFGTDYRNSVRFASKYVAMLDAISISPTTTVFTWPDPETDLKRFVSEVIDAARQKVDDDHLTEIVRRIVPTFRTGDRVPVHTVISPRSVLHEIVAEKAPEATSLLPGLGDVLGRPENGAGARLMSKTVPAHYFSIFDGRETPATSPVELTGGARILVNGPLLHFVPGIWTAIPTFRVSDNRPSNAFYFDVVCGYDVSGGTLRLPAEGVFSSALPFVVPSSRNPVEVRFRIVEGAISGSFELFHVRFEPGHDDQYAAQKA